MSTVQQTLYTDCPFKVDDQHQFGKQWSYIEYTPLAWPQPGTGRDRGLLRYFFNPLALTDNFTPFFIPRLTTRGIKKIVTIPCGLTKPFPFLSRLDQVGFVCFPWVLTLFDANDVRVYIWSSIPLLLDVSLFHIIVFNLCVRAEAVVKAHTYRCNNNLTMQGNLTHSHKYNYFYIL